MGLLEIAQQGAVPRGSEQQPAGIVTERPTRGIAGQSVGRGMLLREVDREVRLEFRFERGRLHGEQRREAGAVLPGHGEMQLHFALRVAYQPSRLAQVLDERGPHLTVLTMERE